MPEVVAKMAIFFSLGSPGAFTALLVQYWSRKQANYKVYMYKVSMSVCTRATQIEQSMEAKFHKVP